MSYYVQTKVWTPQERGLESKLEFGKNIQTQVWTPQERGLESKLEFGKKLIPHPH